MIKFNYDCQVEMEAEHLRLVSTALETVWTHYFSDDTEFNIYFLSLIILIGAAIPPVACYSSEGDVIRINVPRLKATLGNLSFESKLVLVAAHEAMHRVQFHRGTPPPAFEDSVDYYNCPFEDEAWREAIKVHRILLPDTPVRIILDSGKEYRT